MLARSSQQLASALALAMSVGGCAARPPAPTRAPAIPAELSRFLLDPRKDCAAADPVDPEAVEAHRRLLADGDVARAESTARGRLSASSAGGSDWRAVLAQALLVGSRASEVVEVTSSPPADVDNCAAIAVARGRAFELIGDPASAYGAYRIAGRSVEIAAARAAALGDEARQSSRDRFSAAMAKGHRDAAGWHLERLEIWFPRSEAALRSRMELAAASGDLERELGAARALDESGGGPDVALRRAELELVAGDARAGLARLEQLAASAPGDPALAAALERGRFAWRLHNAPDPVRRLSRLAELSRADFAVLVYWMVPPVRTARPAAGRIASDVLDHPAREEIVRLVNLGLMTVDETLHRFSPGAPVRRGEALRVLQRTIRQFGTANACGAGAEIRESPCESAVACGLIAAGADCAPGATLSGREAIELLRGALALAGGG